MLTSKFPDMSNSVTMNHLNSILLDLSEVKELNFWAEKLGVRPESLKTAVRASRSNALDQIIIYLKSCNQIHQEYLPTV
ncbi:hypothetical protein PBAL39_14034 [Pedobacter sp. BAL39]|nr:hypothetical protein PBAL39_14034 [Pedobacter sp. BAL39]